MTEDFNKIPNPTVPQIRAARHFFGWTQADAAPRFDVGLTTLVDLERSARTPNSVTRAKIGLALLKLGVRFDDDGNMTLPPEPPQT